jgi:hypothetical protein
MKEGEVAGLDRLAAHSDRRRQQSQWPDPHQLPAEGWAKPLGMVAQPGTVGEFVAALLPHTEADTAALVFQLLAAVGSVIGAGPYYQVESDKHTAG